MDNRQSSFFKFLDNRFRNLSLDSQIQFSLRQDGQQKAVHAWVLGIRRFWKVVYVALIPFIYLSKVVHLTSQDQNHEDRLTEMKAYTEKILNAAKKAQADGQPLSADPSDLIKPDSVKEQPSVPGKADQATDS